MNTPSDGVLSMDSERVERAPAPQVRPFSWSVRRELWENRFLYIGPLVVAAFVLFGAFVSLATLPDRLQKVTPQRQGAVMVKPVSMAPAPIMFATILIGLFYSLDALYGERRDRSILFWKSLPISDATTVLSKASVPIVVLPLIGYALSMVVQVILLFFSAPILAAAGFSPAALWTEFGFFEGLLIMIYGLTVFALWYAPIYAYLMLISAWARRAPFLWAVLPVLAIAAVERIVFSTTLFLGLIGWRFGGPMKVAFRIAPKGPDHVDINRLSQLDPLRFLGSPGLWVGLFAAAGFLAGAVWLRRNREPI